MTGLGFSVTERLTIGEVLQSPKSDIRKKILIHIQNALVWSQDTNNVSA
jgi:hypothetical protein